jgi:hypothetical protein
VPEPLMPDPWCLTMTERPSAARMLLRAPVIKPNACASAKHCISIRAAGPAARLFGATDGLMKRCTAKPEKHRFVRQSRSASGWRIHLVFASYFSLEDSFRVRTHQCGAAPTRLGRTESPSPSS